MTADTAVPPYHTYLPVPQVYEAVKRSTQDATTDAKEAARSAMHKAGAGGDIMGGMAAAASQAAGAVGSKLSEASQK